MLTAGAHIASMVTVEAATTAAAAGRPSTVIMLTATMIVATADRMADRTVKRTVDPTADLMVVESMADRTVAANITAAEHPTVVERLMVVADTRAADMSISNQ